MSWVSTNEKVPKQLLESLKEQKGAEFKLALQFVVYLKTLRQNLFHKLKTTIENCIRDSSEK